MTSIRIPKDVKKKLHQTILKCDEQVDYQGWRFSESVGYDEFDPFDIDDEEIQKGFWYAHLFLKTNFGRKGKAETVSSYDLKHAFDKWWSVEFPNSPKIFVSNGVILLAIVFTGLCPDELWYSMDLNQNACISKPKWKAFCKKYDYRLSPNFDED